MRRASLNTLCAFVKHICPESVNEMSLTPLCTSALAYLHRSNGNTLDYWGREETSSKKTYRHTSFRNNRFDMFKEFLLFILIKRQQRERERKGMGSGLFKRKKGFHGQKRQRKSKLPYLMTRQKEDIDISFRLKIDSVGINVEQRVTHLLTPSRLVRHRLPYC